MRISFFIFALQAIVARAATPENQEILYRHYLSYASIPSDINEHLPTLRELASECHSAAEIGIRNSASTWGLLQGLSESPYPMRSYLGANLYFPSNLQFLKNISAANQIDFQFLLQNDLTIDLEPVDLLFINSIHTYCHLSYELELFSLKTRKYIVVHHTSGPWGEKDDPSYRGDYLEYPQHISRDKKGLWPAVVDFLNTHPEWKLKERRFNNHGLAILERIEETPYTKLIRTIESYWPQLISSYEYLLQYFHWKEKAPSE